jgi:hypothetical protein
MISAGSCATIILPDTPSGQFSSPETRESLPCYIAPPHESCTCVVRSSPQARDQEWGVGCLVSTKTDLVYVRKSLLFSKPWILHVYRQIFTQVSTRSYVGGDPPSARLQRHDEANRQTAFPHACPRMDPTTSNGAACILFDAAKWQSIAESRPSYAMRAVPGIPQSSEPAWMTWRLT